MKNRLFTFKQAYKFLDFPLIVDIIKDEVYSNIPNAKLIKIKINFFDKDFKEFNKYFYFKHYTTLKTKYFITILKTRFYNSTYVPNDIRVNFKNNDVILPSNGVLFLVTIEYLD